MKDLLPHYGCNVIADFSLPSFYDTFSTEGVKDSLLKLDLEQKLKFFQTIIKN